MNAQHLADNLNRIFTEENRRVIFWDDDAGEFAEIIYDIAANLEDAELVRRDETLELEIKIRVELDEPARRFLIYAAQPAPPIDDDWLYDIRLYSRTFEADTASMLVDELNLNQRSLRDYLAQRKSFFRSTERLQRLKRFADADDTARDLDRKMIAVTVRAEQPEIFAILTRLFGELCAADAGDLYAETTLWAELARYDLHASFWTLMRESFGFVWTDDAAAPKLSDLLLRLFVTDFALALPATENNLQFSPVLPPALRELILPNANRRFAASVFLNQWRNDISTCRTYNRLAAQVERELKIDNALAAIPEAALIEVETFEEVEKRLASGLRDEVINHRQPLELASFNRIIKRRLEGHWAHPHVGASEDESENPYRAVYGALEAAAELFSLRRKYDEGFNFSNASSAFALYTAELYRFDNLYRRFCVAADRVELQRGWDIVRALRDEIENCYSLWFIDRLAVAWNRFFEGEASLLSSWKINGVPNQQNFYRRHVAPLLDSSKDARVFVITSDALRYEAAVELAEKLNRTNRLEAKTTAQLGVLPSITPLGMAALLPHTQLSIKATNTNFDVLVDGLSTTGFDARATILRQVKGRAIRADDLLAMNKEQGREFVREARIIYVYHNLIDRTGETNEAEVFAAVERAIDELAGLARYIVNSLNGSQILITADHGFLFSETAPSMPDRSDLEARPAGTIRAKKRYVVGYDLGAGENVRHGSTTRTASTANELEFWIPRGANRFHFVGGARFVHGGAMPQEIVVPIVAVKLLRGRAAEQAEIRTVNVSLLGTTRRIVNNVQRFEFVQTEPVTERVQPLTLLVSLRDSSNNDALISNEVTLIFDSPSSVMEERKRHAQIIVRAGNYDRRKTYALVLRDAKKNLEYSRTEITIDLALINDF